MTFWPRFLMMLLNTVFYTAWVLICMIGVDVKDPKVGKIRSFLIKKMGLVSCRFHTFCAGLFWVKIEYVTDCGYEKFLGPDWKPVWTGSGTMVANHVCWMDIVVTLAYFAPSFLSKRSVQNIPGIGIIATAIDCVFLDRAGSKEEKIRVAKQIEER